MMCKWYLSCFDIEIGKLHMSEKRVITQIRVPENLMFWLRARARYNYRSMNSEILELMRNAKELEMS